MSKKPPKYELEQASFKPVVAKNESQRLYLKAIAVKTPVVIGIGAAGTGKTYLACASAVEGFNDQQFAKIVIVRPAVATEDIGFLPGDLQEKLDPYMRPIYDALEERWSPHKVKSMLDNGQIELAPLAFMRGRTFHNCFIILDEAQNTTISQIKMLLTRFGTNCQCVITGDTTQTDLRGTNGLQWAVDRLKDCPVVETVEFFDRDSVRSETVLKLLPYLT